MNEGRSPRVPTNEDTEIKRRGISSIQRLILGCVLLAGETTHEEPLSRNNMTGVYLFEDSCCRTKSEEQEMESIPYAELVGGLNYLKTRTPSNIS